MKADLRARLVAQLAAMPIDWVENRPGAGLPRIVLTQIGGGEDVAHDGASGLAQARVQVDCIAASAAAAAALALQAKAALRSYRGGVISAVFVADQRDLPGGNASAGERLAGVSVDVMVHYQEQVA